jgi:hypothetical protein
VEGVGVVKKGMWLGKGRSSTMVVLVLATALLAGCGSDAPLADLGHMTERWIAAAPEPTTTTTFAPSVVAPVGLLATSGSKTIDWVNDELGDRSRTVPASPEETILAVWSRSNRQDQYVQASRTEILAALPGLGVPTLIPENVAFVTSQLIFDPSTGGLSSPAAAFGFWSEKPYTKSRSVAQLAVLMVAIDEPIPEPVVPDTIGVPEAPAGPSRCDELTDSTVQECAQVTLEDGCPAWSLAAADGWRLVWSEHGFTYDLFVRNAGNADLLARMASSCEDLVPVVSVLAGPDDGQGSSAGNETEPTGEQAGS